MEYKGGRDHASHDPGDMRGSISHDSGWSQVASHNDGIRADGASDQLNQMARLGGMMGGLNFRR